MFKIMFYVSLALAVFFLIVSVVLFVRNNVSKLIGDVTGWNTKRAKKEFLRKNVEEYSKLQQDKHLESSRNNRNRKKKMPIFSEVERSLSEEEVTISLGEEVTMLLNENETTLLGEDVTTLLAEEETSVLAEEVTTLLAEEETTILTEDSTTLLVAEGNHASNDKDVMIENIFEVEESMMVIHTNESIDE